MHIRKNILFFADRLPPLTGGMEMHAKYFIEHFKKNQKFPIIGIITKNQKGNDSLILDNKNTEINISDLDKAVNPNIVFFNSGGWIEELKNIHDLFPNAKFLYRTGGNEILKAPLIKNNNPSHKLRQSYWARQINENINVLITNSLYTEKRLAALGIKAPFKRFVGGVNIPDLKKIKYIKSGFVTIFCAARFVPYKNHSLMISIIKELSLCGVKFKVKLAGDGPLLSKVKQQVVEYELNHIVEFVGNLSNAEVCHEIFKADIYMQLSKEEVTKVEGGSYIHSEGMGRSILESLSAGTFVVVAKSGALPEIVQPPYGLLIDLNNGIKEIANQIKPIIQNPPSKIHFKGVFDWKKLFINYEKLF